MMSIGTMAELKCVVFWGFFTLLWTLSRGDLEVSCHFSRTCLLPCSFPPGDQVVIHWIRQLPSKLQVHSYYHNQDQLEQQSDEFKGRTSLYNQLISTGNASLNLSNVMVQDEGRYQCYTSTINGNKETFILLKVYAPMANVNIEQLGNKIVCSSDWIYPKPTLSWNINPNIVPQETPVISENEQKLYKISSSIILPANFTDAYSCTINTTKSLTYNLFKQAHKNSSYNEARLDCQPVNAPLNYFTWRFNHSQLILTWNKTSHQATEGWKSHVNDVSNNGSLWLKDLTSNQEGMYTCQSGNNDGESEKSTVLNIINDGGSNTAGIVVGVIFGIIMLLICVVICCRRRRRRRIQN